MIEPERRLPSFDAEFVALFDAHFHRLFRYLDRLADDPELGADLAQETFLRLYRRGRVPDAPEAWLITVAMNLFRNARTTRARRRRLLTLARAEHVHGDAARSPAAVVHAAEERSRVRAALDALPERERRILLLAAEGYEYRIIAQVLDMNATSVGTTLARARTAFRRLYGDDRG